MTYYTCNRECELKMDYRDTGMCGDPFPCPEQIEIERSEDDERI